MREREVTGLGHFGMLHGKAERQLRVAQHALQSFVYGGNTLHGRRARRHQRRVVRIVRGDFIGVARGPFFVPCDFILADLGFFGGEVNGGRGRRCLRTSGQRQQEHAGSRESFCVGDHNNSVSN